MAQQQRFWLTTHYPHPRDGGTPWYLYLRPKFRGQRDVRAGDAVAFYETSTPPPKSLRQGPASPGAGAIVCIAEVGGSWRARKPSRPADEYTLEAVCVYHKFDGCVRRSLLNQIMGWKPGYTLPGIGGGSGLIEISVEQFKAICAAFFRSAR